MASTKAEYAARTFRPRIAKHLDDYLKLHRAVKPKHTSLNLEIGGIDLKDIDSILLGLEIDRKVPSVSVLFKGGCQEAKKRLRSFIRNRLAHYDAHSNQPQTDDISTMSPYLSGVNWPSISFTTQVTTTVTAAFRTGRERHWPTMPKTGAQ